MTTRITAPFGFSFNDRSSPRGYRSFRQARRAIVTGALSVIGIETARAPASVGAEVTLAVRNLPAGREVARAISESTKNPNVRVGHLEPSEHYGSARTATFPRGVRDAVRNQLHGTLRADLGPALGGRRFESVRARHIINELAIEVIPMVVFE